MLISVLLKEKQFFISCGPATQPASWLAHVACLRYDTTLGQHIGPPVALRRVDGEKIVDWTQPIQGCVADGEQLIVVLRSEKDGQQGDEDHELIRPIKDDERDEKEQLQYEEEEEEAEEGGDDDEPAAMLHSGSSDEEVK